MEIHHNTPPVTFGVFLRQRRRQLGLTLIELQLRTGVHNSRLSRWERDIHVPTHPDRLALLARGLDLPLADIYAAAGHEIPGIPSLATYMRQTWGTDLPDKAISEIADAIKTIVARYGATFASMPSNRVARATTRSRRRPPTDHDETASHP